MKTIRFFAISFALIGFTQVLNDRSVRMDDPTKPAWTAAMGVESFDVPGKMMTDTVLEGPNKMDNPILSPIEF